MTVLWLLSLIPGMGMADSEEIPVIRQVGADDTTTRIPVGQASNPLDLEWTLREAVEEGHWLRVRTSNLVFLNRVELDRFECRVDGETLELEITDRHTRERLFNDWNYWGENPYKIAARAPRHLPAGSELSSRGEMRVPPVSEADYTFRVETAASLDGPWKPVTGWDSNLMAAGPAVALEANLRADGSLHIVYIDEWGNPATVSERTLTLRGRDGQTLATAEIDGTSFLFIPAETIGSAVERVDVSDDHGFTCLSSARPRSALDGSPVFFGEVHLHTEYSKDAHRPLEDTLVSGRDHLGLDWMTASDHAKFKPGYTIEGYYDRHDRINEAGRFATLLGFEMSTARGHFNAYFKDRDLAEKGYGEALDDFLATFDESEPHHLPLQSYYAHFEPGEVIVVPHHTNTISGPVLNEKGLPFWRPFDWSEVDDRFSPLAEMCQGRGSFEAEEIDEYWKILDGGYGSSVRGQLDRGLRLGIIAGSDNHQGWPTRRNGRGYVGLTAVQAPELSREALFEAMMARRTYGTTGARMVLDFSLNDSYPMGSEVRLSPLDERVFRVVAKGTAPLTDAQIISQGAVVADLDVDGTDELDLTWRDERPGKPMNDCYYYLRVRQEDGHVAWSSPIWVDYLPGSIE